MVHRILTHAAQAAVKKKGGHFQSLLRRFLPRLHYNGAISAIAPARPLGLENPPNQVRYIEQGQETNPAAKKRRPQKMVQALRKLGYAVALTPSPELE
jgi:hypothetical protein